MKVALVVLTLLCMPSSASASTDIDVGLFKNQKVVIKIPRKLYQYENASIATGAAIYTVSAMTIDRETNPILREADPILVVGGHRNWAEIGWPLMMEFYFDKAKTKKEYHELEFRSASAYIKLRLDVPSHDVRRVLYSLVYPGSLYTFEKTDYYRETLIGKVLPKIFVDALSKLPIEKQIGLLKAVRYNDEAIRYERFKNANYLSFGLGDDPNVYNTLRLNQHSRAARVINDLVLPSLKEAALYITDTPEIGGIKMAIRILYKDFLQERNIHPHAEVLEIYAPYNLIEKFFNLDITNQQLVDGSVILMNGNRMQVSLAGAQ
ncbi:MAG: hypothetical protein L0226_09695 [Acidobacteria bacterium]|nr:hypothetical protein [Acidobacteriota bacterium]